MLIDTRQLTPNQRYAVVSHTLLPRPIAWILTRGAAGQLNLAPFSYFNAICSDPPLLMVSIGKKPDGTEKDTRVNIRERDAFVVHIARPDQLQALNDSAATLPAETSEVAQLGLATTAFGDFPLPRLADCPVAYACTCWEYHEIGPARQAIVYGEIRHIHLDDAIARYNSQGRLEVDSAALDPLARLGASEYARLGEIIHLPRPA